MENKEDLGLPFVTRKQLAFEGGAAFGLVIKSQALTAQTFFIKGMTKEGPFNLKVITAAGAAIETNNFRIPDIPIYLTISTNSYLQGELFVTASVSVNNDILFELCSGHVYAGKGLSYPIVDRIDHRSRGGRLIVKQGTDPAAGAEISIVVPSNVQWRFLALNFALSTDATVADRRVRITVTDTGLSYMDVFSSAVQAASLLRVYNFADYPNWLADIVGNRMLSPFPPNIIMNPGTVIETITVNLQAGDNYGAPKYYVEEFIKAPTS